VEFGLKGQGTSSELAEKLDLDVDLGGAAVHRCDKSSVSQGSFSRRGTSNPLGNPQTHYQPARLCSILFHSRIKSVEPTL
jgi:hypothetical protein